jgi:hypothetical protein
LKRSTSRARWHVAMPKFVKSIDCCRLPSLSAHVVTPTLLALKLLPLIATVAPLAQSAPPPARIPRRNAVLAEKMHLHPRTE